MSKPDLKSWTQERLAALYTAPTDEEFHLAFESAFASDERAKVIINGEQISRDKLKEEIRAQRGPMVKADVKFDELIEIPEATVKGSWSVTRSLKFRIRAAPAQMERVGMFEARVEPVSPGSNEFRIVHLSETVENKQKPIVINAIPRNHGGEAQGSNRSGAS